MSRSVFPVLLCLFALVSVSHAVPVPAFNGTWAGAYSQFSGVIGWEFEPQADMWVTHLGTYDYYGNGLPYPVAVGMFDAGSQRLLTSGVVTRPISSYADWPVFKALDSAVPLTAGERYVVAQLCSVGNPNTWSGYVGSRSWHPDVKLIESRTDSSAGSLTYPPDQNPYESTFSSYYGLGGAMPMGPNFKFEHGPPRPYAAWTDASYGVFVSADDGVIVGEGVVQTDLGAQHRLSAQAMSQVLTDGPKTNECSRKFVFQRGDLGAEPTEVYLIGLLDGFLHATDGGTAKVSISLTLKDASGVIADTSRFFEANAPYGINNFDEEYFNVRPFWVNATIIPGQEYEFISRMTVEARKGGDASTARAMFDNTFEVYVSGEVPEPAALALLAAGVLALLRRRRS